MDGDAKIALMSDDQSVRPDSTIYYRYEAASRKCTKTSSGETGALCVQFANQISAKASGRSNLLLIFFPGIDEDIEHNLIFSKLSTGFVSRAVLAGIEYPGHGRSSGERGVLPTDILLLDMLQAIISSILSDQSCTHFALMGHSAGGLLAVLLSNVYARYMEQGFVVENRSVTFVGAILLAPALDTLVDRAFACCSCGCCCSRHCCSLLAPGWCAIHKLLQCLVLSCGCTCILPQETSDKYDDIGLPMSSEDKSEFQKSLAVDRMTAPAVMTLLDLMRRVQQPTQWQTSALTYPILMVSGTEDKAVPLKSLASFAVARRMQANTLSTSDLKRPLPFQFTSSDSGSQSVFLSIPGATHHILIPGIPINISNGTHDAVDTCVLPTIVNWVDAVLHYREQNQGINSFQA